MDMRSTLYVSLNDTTPENSGIYSCRVNVTINNTDRFTASNTSTVILAGDYICTLCNADTINNLLSKQLRMYLVMYDHNTLLTGTYVLYLPM